MAEATVATETVTGYVERVGERAYGFIVTPDKRRVFFHLRHVEGDCFHRGQRVVAEIIPPPPGKPNYLALAVRPLPKILKSKS